MSRRSMRILGVLICCLAGCCLAFGKADLAVIYNGDASIPAGATFGDWGYLPRAASPDAASFQPVSIGDSYGLTLATLGRYQGTRIDFSQPVDTSNLFGVKNTFLEMYIRTAPSAQPSAGVPAGADIMWGTLLGQTASASADKNSPQLPAFSNLRFTFVTEKGIGELVLPSAQFYPKDQVGTWIRIGIPLTSINAKTPVGGMMTRMLITSDTPMKFLVGRLAFVQDDEPMKLSVSILPTFLEAHKRIFFKANVDSGLTRHATSWDFDTASGDSTDATDDRSVYIYNKDGFYFISCTISDPTGGKDPVKKTMKLKVARSQDQ